MANYATLIAALQTVIKQNGNNEITGELLQQALLSMIAELGAGFQIGGVAEPDDTPGTPDYNVAYLAITPGTYSNFGGTTIGAGQIGVFLWNGSWQYKVGTVIEIINNLYDGGVNSVLSAEQGKQIWASISKLLSGVFSDNIVDVHSGAISSSGQRVTGDFFLKAGIQYTWNAVFNSQPASGAQINIWIFKSGTSTPYLSRIICYESSWDTVRQDTFTVEEDGMYYVMIRAIGSSSSVGVTIKMPNPLYFETLGALVNYAIPAGPLVLGDLILKYVWANDETPEYNAYRISTQIFRIAHPHFKISCNYADGYSYYLYRKVGSAFSAIASNKTEDAEFEWNGPAVFYIAVRAGGAVVTDSDIENCGLAVTMLEDTFKVVPDVDDSISKSEARTDEKIDGVSRLITSENTIETQFDAGHTAITRASNDFFLKAGQQYTLTAGFDAQPTDDAQVNIWIYKTGTVTGYIGRVILNGGEEWDGPRSVQFSPVEDGEYYIAYRVVLGGAQTVTISASVSNPFYNAGGGNEDVDGLPGYYFPYIENRVLAAKKHLASCGAGSAAMFFITDTHHPQNFGKSDAMLEYLSARLQVRAILYGGDICPSTTANWGGNAANAKEAICLSDNAVTKLLSSAKAFIYRTRGNHDYSVADHSYWRPGKSYNVGQSVVWSELYGGGDNYTYTCIEANSDATFDPTKWEKGEIGGLNLSQIEAQRLILADAEANGNCVFPDNNTKAAYYYFDIPRSKIRVVVWDVCDSDSGFKGVSNVTQNITNGQFLWIIQNAILTTPDGYNIVTLGHDPTYINQLTNSGDGYINDAWNEARRQLVHAINNNTTFTIAGQTFDFSELAAKIILNLNGHNHSDSITKVDGAFAVTTAGDWWNNVTKYSVMYKAFNLSALVSRDGGTTREQAFDLMIIDQENDYIKFIRFGAGIDRLLKMTQESAVVGTTKQITSSLTGSLQYYVFDANSREADPDETGHWWPTENLASIDSDGVLTPIAAGDVVVMVYDADAQTIELIGVTIQ